MTYSRNSTIVNACYGNTDVVLDILFPQADAHVLAWRRATWLHKQQQVWRECEDRLQQYLKS